MPFLFEIRYFPINENAFPTLYIPYRRYNLLMTVDEFVKTNSAFLAVDENRSIKAGRVLQNNFVKKVMVARLDYLKLYASDLRDFT